MGICGRLVKRVKAFWRADVNVWELNLTSLHLVEGDLVMVEYPERASNSQVGELIGSMREAIIRAPGGGEGISLIVAPKGSLNISSFSEEDLKNMGLVRVRKEAKNDTETESSHP